MNTRKDYRLQVEWRPISEVKPYARNHKKHPPSQIQALAQQISAMGFDQPICVDKDGVIIKGHGRREAAIQAGMTEVPVVVRSDLTEYECMQARIADNKLPTYGEIDEDVLRFEFGTLQSHGMDLKLTGFELGEIEDILEPEAEEEEREPAPPKEKDATQFIVAVHCKDEPQMQELYGELKRRDLDVRLIT